MDQEMIEKLSNIQDDIEDIIYDLKEMKRAFEEEEIEDEKSQQINVAISDMNNIIMILRYYTW